jgi:predicted dinucleotide-binding enzyme
MKIGVIGSGDVGRVLGAGFAAEGHQVMLGTRDPGQEKVCTWVAQTGANASASTFPETANFAELAVLATAWSGTQNAIQLAGPDRLAGKVVIDATNPLDFSGACRRSSRSATRTREGSRCSAGSPGRAW